LAALNRCQPALIAKELAKFGVVNIGAVGTFVVRADVSESVLRNCDCEKVTVQMRDHDLSRARPHQSRIKESIRATPLGSGHHPVRQRASQTTSRAPTSASQSNPRTNDWLLKIIAIENRFIPGLYRRQMKAISYLGKIEKQLVVPVTTRNWNTIEKVAKILRPRIQRNFNRRHQATEVSKPNFVFFVVRAGLHLTAENAGL